MKKLLLLFISAVSLNLVAQDRFNDADIQNYLKENLETLGLTNGDIDDYNIDKSYVSDGIEYISIVQSIDGVPVEGAIINLTIKNKKVVYFGNRFIKNLDSKVVNTKFALNGEDAFEAVQTELGYVTRSAPKVIKVEDGKTSFEQPIFANKDVVVQKKYFYNSKEDIVSPTWEVEISMSTSADYWLYKIDANTKQVLDKRNLTLYCKFGHAHSHTSSHSCEGTASKQTTMLSPSLVEKPVVSGTYNVFPIPLEAPSFGDQTVVTQPHFESASPFGWHDTNGIAGDEFTITRGNNVHAFETDITTAVEPDGGDDLIFDFAYDPQAEPQDQTDVTLTQLFYLVNIIHDITYGLGFNEQSGNFQQNNYGNGGSQNDQAQAIVDFTFANNASMATPPDGQSPTLRMGVFTQTSSVVQILEPEQLEGDIDFGAIGDGWGYVNYDDFDVTAEIAIAFDASIQGATEVCDEVVNTSDVQGKIALIDRGGCEFGTKALNAQNAGAVGVLICNRPGINGGDGEEFIGMAGGADGINVVIPAAFLQTSVCNRIRASINSGTPVEMQIKPAELDGPTLRGSALDNGIIIHEFMHGITNRMSNGLNSAEQMGEGWSDILALVLTHELGDTGEDSRGIGTYALGESVTGGGIRRFPYSRDMSINPQTYADLPNTGAGVHPIGELWVAMTWDMYWNFVDEYGFDATWQDEESGNFKATRLILEALKLQPAGPGFVDGRNAIIGADQILYNGENECLIWNAFSRRGLGINADQGSPDDIADGVPNFENTLRCNPRLDIKRTVSDLITAGNTINVTSTVTNFTEDEQTNVIVKEVLETGLSFVEGSSNYPATVSGNEITFDIGTIASEGVIDLSYEISTPAESSQTLYYDELQDNSQYIVDFASGFNNWSLNSDQARSGTRSVNIPDVTSAADIRLVYQDLEVSGDNPAFRFWHKYETNSGSNGGFLEVSTDGLSWFPVADKMIRNGYNSIISYANLVIPNLQGYTGTNLDDWQDVIIDLSEYAGQTISMRFRFATADPADITGLTALSGWFVDDVEVMDLVSYITTGCASSDQFGETCAEEGLTIVDSEIGGTSTEDEQFDSNLNMSLYPNPANDQVVLQLNSSENYTAQLSIDNIDGKRVYSDVISIDNVTSITKIDTRNFAKGMYLVKIQSGNAIKTEKLVIN